MNPEIATHRGPAEARPIFSADAGDHPYRNVVENFHQAILFVDGDGVIQWANGQARFLFGDLTPTSLTGHSFPLKIIAEGHQAMFQEVLKTLPHSASWSGELQLRRKDNGSFPAKINLSYWIDPSSHHPWFWAVIQDLSENFGTDKTLRQNEEKFRKVFEDGPLGMALLGNDHSLIKVNKRLCHMLGFTESELLSSSFSKLTHPDDLSASDQLTRLLQRGVIPYFTVEKRLYRKDQSMIWTQWTGSLVPDLEENQNLGLVMIQEITERKYAEKALSQYAERLEALHRIDQGILAAQSPNKIAEVALQHLKHLTRCACFSIQEFDEGTGLLKVLAVLADSIDEAEPETVSPLNPDLKALLRKGQTVVLTSPESPSQPGSIPAHLLRAGIRCYLYVPLLLQDDLIGTMEVGARDEQYMTRNHLAIVEEIATMMTVSLKHARLNERTRQDAQTKAILLNEVNHRVKNNLTAIIGLLYAHQRLARNQDTPLTWGVMKDLINGIQGLATAHRLLSESEFEPLLLDKLASQVLHACFKALPPDKLVTIDICPSTHRVSAPQANSVAMVLAELAMNTLKYGLGESPQIKVQIQIALAGEHIELTYRDNGPGYPESTLTFQRQTVGLYLIKSLVENDLRGELKLNNNHGAVTVIRIKASPL